MNIQFKKGVLELCVLSMLFKKDCYGYELVNQISKNISIAEGTIYPLLLRLEKNNFITAKYRESALGPKRKYFSITLAGEKELEAFINNWQELNHAVNQLFYVGE
jgi:PadR family transcriptional regulator PadR